MKTRTLSIIAFIGAACIALGVYTLIPKQTMEDKPFTAKDDNTRPINSSTSSVSSATGSWRIDQKGPLNTTRQWIEIGRFKGRIKVVMTGEAIFDSHRAPVSPEGIPELAPPGFTVPGIEQYCCLAKFNGKILKVGRENDFYIDGVLFLGPNEDVAASHGKGFANNSGGWTYTIFIKG